VPLSPEACTPPTPQPLLRSGGSGVEAQDSMGLCPVPVVGLLPLLLLPCERVFSSGQVGNTERVYRNAQAAAVQNIEAAHPGDFSKIHHLVKGELYRQAFQETGDTQNSVWSCGQVTPGDKPCS
jgi:hypothetical protein